MGILNIFSKNKDGKLKRAELKVHSKDSKIRVRGSRTGGINASYSPVRGITFNSKHGMRVSKTFKGLTFGFRGGMRGKGGKAFVRGRWSSEGGLLNTNLSKKGLSFSTKTKHATYNWTRPNYSSVKIAGVQFRGKKAKDLAQFLAIAELMSQLIIFSFKLLYNLILTLIYITPIIFQILVFVTPIIFQVIVFVAQVAFQIVFFIGESITQLMILTFHLLLFLTVDLPRQIFDLAVNALPTRKAK